MKRVVLALLILAPSVCLGTNWVRTGVTAGQGDAIYINTKAVAVRIRYGDWLAVCGLLVWARIEPECEPLYCVHL